MIGSNVFDSESNPVSNKLTPAPVVVQILDSDSCLIAAS